MPASRLSYAFLLGFVLSVFALHWWQLAVYPPALWIGLGSIAFASAYALLYRAVRPRAALCLASALGVALSFCAVSRSVHAPAPGDVDALADGRIVAIAGVIAEEPDRRPAFTQYTVETHSLRQGSGTLLPLRGKLLVTDFARWPRYDYGDAVEARGALKLPGSADDPSYRLYLSRFGIHAAMAASAIRPTGSGGGNRVLGSLYALKESFEARIESLYPEPHASLLEGLLTGSRRGIPPHLTESFQRTGLSHLIAISGYNITVILASLSALLFWLPLRWRLVPSLLGLIAFTLLVGASASVVRAAIMGVLGLFAVQLGRPQTIRLTILWTLFLILAWNPLQLWYDAGFQLSFLALAGIVEVAPLLESTFAPLPDALGIRDMLRLTVSAQIAAAPWMLFLFAQLSLIAPFANLLAPPAVPYAMLTGFLSVLASVVWFPLGQLVASLSFLCLGWIVGVADILGKIPLGSLRAEGTSASFVAVYYVLLIGWMIHANRRTPKALTEPA